jgi:hypothetical protein
MANTGNFIWNELTVNGTPYTIPLDAVPEDIVDLTSGLVTIEQAQNLIDNRVVVNSPSCVPFCLPVLITDEVPIEGVLDDSIGVSLHAMIDGVETCVTGILTI